MGQLSGDISLMPLSDLMIWLANRQMSGRLVAELGTIKKEFSLDRGAVVRAASNEPREHFRQFLLHFGLVSEPQLHHAFAVQEERRERLGRVLVMIDAVSEERVLQVLKVKIAETVLDAFRWGSGRFVFTSDPVNEESRNEVPVSVPLLSIHREGVARSGTWDHFQRVFPNPQHVLYVDDSRLPSDLQRDSLDGRIITLARQGLTIEALALELHATDYQLAARLFDLHQAGVLHSREPSYELASPFAQLKPGKSYAELAREALAADSYGEALQHLESGARQNPDDPEFTALKREVEDQAMRKMDRELARYAVPALLKELGTFEKKRLTAKERYVLARIDGYRTIDAIIAVSPMLDIEALEILKKFLGEGLIRI